MKSISKEMQLNLDYLVRTTARKYFCFIKLAMGEKYYIKNL